MRTWTRASRANEYIGETMTAVTERLVTTEEAARALNVHPVTLRRWVKAGIVSPADRTAGGHARWDVETLRDQVSKHLAADQDHKSR